ncbi:murein DD-endopeptidase MepM/ murein hydrolase activator NlpD [Streptomyces sp. B3I7]|uniref:M23 family metallopeptidase n=1 Tax=unclassified Streptomyces TaxID=2593676 RepID=UPI00277FBB62|nr:MULTISPECIES: M23 family metallopeptidase [unclassified Streptomyces]MDQ0788404.1 murein DD-endopeptidase MepM/ murein hydrolase activator NlpD [Streptomyces sp. B3I8]MDQ0811989.1 murein DD-endopeptidase MepM/ murein hydrolase activator NlpD [Streptomyces sp. B3I7]
MSFRSTLRRHPRTSSLRTRAAVLGVGLGASVVLGAGAAVAADTVAATPISATSSTLAAAVRAQAAAQAEAATHAEQAAAAAKAKAKAAKANAKAAAVKKAASWVDPVKKYALSAGFDQNGSHWAHKHSGQDFAVPIGTDVVAAHGGTVVKAGGNGAGDGPAYGNAIVVKHANGTYSQYAHLSRIDVRPGQVVATGQHIARSGNTGNSTGPHLHFEIRKTPNYGSAVNPVAFLRSHGTGV